MILYSRTVGGALEREKKHQTNDEATDFRLARFHFKKGNIHKQEQIIL